MRPRQFSPDNRAKAVRFVAATLVALLVYGGYALVADRDITGDEPDYLRMALSLARDGDVDLTNDQASAERTDAAHALPGPVQGGDYRGDGVIRDVHPIGTAVVLLPAVATADATGFDLAKAGRATMIVLAALASGLMMLLALHVSGGRDGPALFGWAAASFTFPVLPFSSQIYGEVPGLLVVTLALVAMSRRSARWTTDLTFGLCLAALPWIQNRFVFVAAALGAAWVLHDRHRLQLRRLALAGGPSVVALAALSVWNLRLYGSFGLSGGHSGLGYEVIHQPQLERFRIETISTFFAHNEGWLLFAPIAIVALPAAAIVALRHPIRAAERAVIGGGFLVYVGAVTSLATVGFALPGRFIVVCAPALVIGTVALCSTAPRRWMVGGLLAVSVSIAVLSATVGSELNVPFETNEVPIARELARIYPTSPKASGDVITDRSATDSPHKVGEIAVVDGRAAVSGDPARDEAGFLLFGAHHRVTAGVYRGSFALWNAEPGGELCAELMLDGRDVRDRQCTSAIGWHEVTLETTADLGQFVELRVQWDGTSDGAVGDVRLERIVDLRPVRGAPWATTWIGVVCLIGVGLWRRGVDLAGASPAR